MRWRILGLALFAIVVAVFTIVNSTTVTVDFVFHQVTVNLVLVILLSVFLGMALMAILWSMHAWKVRGLLKQAERRIAELEQATSNHTRMVPEPEGNDLCETPPYGETSHTKDKTHEQGENVHQHERINLFDSE
ncbi:MAG: LapA family protein [Alicyclobacillus sp.]|nr:LapA family protein [Alicyclobacillus sp.]